MIEGSSSMRQRPATTLGLLHLSSEPSSLNGPPKAGAVSEKSSCSSRGEGLEGCGDDDEGLLNCVITLLKVALCSVVMLVNATIWGVIMLLLMPWPAARIKQSNVFGYVTGKLLMRILGNPLTVEGAEHANTKAIYICNHASILDIFVVMMLIPWGTVGIAKKEIIWYPFFGQLYVLANHLRIDRSNPAAAIKSINEAANNVVKENLSLVIFPEGTRSLNGRLLPFKKGCVHLAIRTKRPIVPIVLQGTHLACRKSSLNLRPNPLKVTVLPPIKTDDWELKKIEEYVEMLHTTFAKHLPESQRPLPKLTQETCST